MMADPTTPAPTATSVLPPAPLLGRPWEWRHAVIAGLGSVAVCTVYVLVTRRVDPSATPSAAEFLGTTTSLWSVWITQRRNVLAQPIGIVSVALMGWVFLQVGLAGQVLLHWAYYLPVQVWAWWHWTRGDDGGELRVTRSPWPVRLGGAVAVVAMTVVLGWVLDAGWEGALLVWWDASIVGASVMAMIAMSMKRVESWWLWIGPVNISAIGLYLRAGAVMFAALYVLFLGMAVVGLLRWQRAADSDVA